MRAREFVSEEYIHNVKIDLKNLARNMAAARFQNEHGQGTNYADAIVYLGLMGDPRTDVELKYGPSLVGQYQLDRQRRERPDWDLARPFQSGLAGDGRSDVNIQGVAASTTDPKELPPDQRRLYSSNATTVNVFVRVRDGEDLNDLATASPLTISTLAHELRHMGFAIINSVPELRNKMRYNQIGQGGQVSDPTSPYFLKQLAHMLPNHNMYIEHAMMYSLEKDWSKTASTGWYNDLEQVRLYQKLYQDAESQTRAWLNRQQNNTANWRELVRYIDSGTPGTDTITIRKDPKGQPEIVHTPPSVSKPNITAKPAGSQPNITAKPAGSQPNITAKPAGSQPNITTKPAGSQPNITTKPAGSQPNITTKPAGSQPNITTKPAGSQPNITTKPAGSQPRKPVPVDPRDGQVGQALARLGVSVQNRRDQQFVDRELGRGFRAGSAEANLALLKKLSAAV